MGIGVTYKVKKFEIDPIFAKKVIQQKLMGGGRNFPPQRGIGLISILPVLIFNLNLRNFIMFSQIITNKKKFMYIIFL